MERIKDGYRALSSQEDKDSYLTEAISFVSEETRSRLEEYRRQINALSSELRVREAELQKANATIERAREFYRDAKTDVDTAEKRVRREMYKSLQIVRDRVYGIIDTAVAAGNRVASDGRSKVSFEELNNIILAADSIISEMAALNLWTESDPRPEVKEFHRKPVAKKKGSNGNRSRKGRSGEPTLPME